MINIRFSKINEVHICYENLKLMITNTGNADRIIRGIIAAVLIILFTTGVVSGQLGTAILVIAVVMLLTAAAGFCPIYSIFGLNTSKEVS